MDTKLRAILALTALVPVLGMAADVYVVANGNLELSPDEVRDVFLGDKQVAGNTKLVPLDNAALQKDFLDKGLKVDAAKYSTIWIKKGFRDGLNQPPVKGGDAEVLAVVKATPGAIGYVSSPPKDLKVIAHY
jgi:ABC-type phosphate transport system substrate-binding protein